MKLEEQVVSLELAGKLKESGFKQKSLWWWTNGYYAEHMGWSNVVKYKLSKKKTGLIVKKRNTKNFHLELGCPKDMDRYGAPDEKHIKWYSAFTVAELGEMLPPEMRQRDWVYGLVCEKNFRDDGWSISYDNSGNSLNDHIEAGDTEANARAKMLIYLKEKGLI